MTPRSPSLPAPRQAGAATPRLACRRLAIGAAFAALIAATAAGAAGGPGIKTPAASKAPAASTAPAAAGLEADRLFAAVVKVQTRAVPDARTSATLGREREGTGMVIGKGGVILTIGYLIVEADDVKSRDSHGRTCPRACSPTTTRRVSGS